MDSGQCTVDKIFFGWTVDSGQDVFWVDSVRCTVDKIFFGWTVDSGQVYIVFFGGQCTVDKWTLILEAMVWSERGKGKY